MSVNSINENSRATDRGTKIVQKGQEIDKNAFLKILTAEMSNQDPTNPQDSTQYISQLAQFSALEQMTNLNTTMSFSSAQSLVGKLVSVSDYDAFGNQYGGYVDSVTKDGDNIKVNITVKENGINKLKTYNLKDIDNVFDKNDNTLYNINSNTEFLLASNMVNKKVEVKDTVTDEAGKTSEVNYTGTVKAVERNNGQTVLKVDVDVDGKIQEKDFYMSSVTKLYDN